MHFNLKFGDVMAVNFALLEEEINISRRVNSKIVYFNIVFVGRNSLMAFI